MAPVPSVQAAPSSARSLRVVLVLTALYFILWRLIAVPLQTPPNDFRVYLWCTQSALAGVNPYGGPDPSQEGPGYVYPLFFMSVTAPFAGLPLAWAERLWLLGNLLLVGLAAWWAGRALRLKDGGGELTRLGVAPLVGVCLVVASLPLCEGVRLGQINVAVGLLIAGAGYMGSTGRRLTGGVLFALAVLVKAQPVLLAPALFASLGVAGLGVAVGVGACYLAFLAASGLWEWEWYHWTVKAPYLARETETFTISIYRTLARIHNFEPATAARIAGALELSLAAMMVVGLVVMWRRRVRGWEWPLSWGIVCALGMSRFLEFHHLSLLCVAYVALARATERTGARIPLIAAVASLSLINFGYVRADLFKGTQSEYIYYAGLAVCGWGVWRAAMLLCEPEVETN